jgi:hypothetical protein
MDVSNLQGKFARMGVRVSVESARGPLRAGSDVRLDVRHDRHGGYFHLMVDADRVESLDVIDIRPADRHLLLMVRPSIHAKAAPKQKFLCGHDERAWFVAAVPEKAYATSVHSAKEALKPPAVRASQASVRLKAKHTHRRRNRAFVRQGEWFFIPRPQMKVIPQLVLRNEPLRRGAGKAHWAEFAFRTGGETVYVSRIVPNGLTVEEYRQWLDRNPTLHGKIRWTTMRRNAQVFVRGRIRHPDHQTVVLQDWHEVQMNTETQAQAMRHVAFLD